MGRVAVGGNEGRVRSSPSRFRSFVKTDSRQIDGQIIRWVVDGLSGMDENGGLRVAERE